MISTASATNMATRKTMWSCRSWGAAGMAFLLCSDQLVGDSYALNVQLRVGVGQQERYKLQSKKGGQSQSSCCDEESGPSSPRETPEVNPPPAPIANVEPSRPSTPSRSAQEHGNVPSIGKIIDDMPLAKAAAERAFKLGPFGMKSPHALRFQVKISDCKDVDGNAVQTKGKYSKLRILYAFDRPMATKHVPTHCRSYGHTKVVAIGLWVVDKQNDPDSPSRRKFFSRFPIDDFMLAYTPFDRPFYQKVMQVVETQRLGLVGDALPAAETHGPIERVLVGHSNAGPGALALFTRYPELFKTAVLVDPAFCDAATRVTLQTSQSQVWSGSAFFVPELDSSQAAKDDQKSTAELFKQIREMGREWEVYQHYYRYLDDRAKTTGTDVLRNADDVLQLAKAGNLLPQSLQAEFERTQKGLRDAFAKNKKVNMAWFLEDDSGLSGPWNAEAKAEAKKWQPRRVSDATKNRIYRTDMLEKLRVAQEGLVNGGRKKRKLLMAVGDGVPRPWGADRAGHIAYQRSDWETDNPFDMIPWQVYLWQHALQEMNMPNLEVKPPLVVPGGHVEAVSPTIERVLKVEHEKTLLDD